VHAAAAVLALGLALGLVVGGCGSDDDEEAETQGEAASLPALPTAVQYRVDGGSLALLSADGTYVVTFARP
jgi:hypothetical protein